MTGRATVHVVDDDAEMRASLKLMLEASGFACEVYESGEQFLRARPRGGCALVDVRMPAMDGLTVVRQMAASGIAVPVIIMTGFADVPLAVNAMKAGAVDFIEKPCPPDQLVEAVHKALVRSETSASGKKAEAELRFSRLTEREREVLELLVVGDANKVIAHKLGISPRTVEIHRSRLMEKANVRNLAEMVRLAIAAEIGLRPKA
jgi:two-component system response regulator FixJ